LASPASPANNVVTSGNKTIATTVSGTFSADYYLSFFKLSQEQGGSNFATQVNILNVAGTTITYEYEVDMGNRLTEISIVFLIFSTTSQPVDVDTVGFAYNNYGSVLNYADSNAPGSTTFDNGYDRMCVIGIA
jgi:hypothetical protein